MPFFPSQAQIITPQESLPDGDFSLLLCTNKERLTKMLSVLWEGRGLAPVVWNDPESGPDYDSLDHMIDLLQSLAYVSDFTGATCYVPPPSAPEDSPFWEDPDNVDGRDEIAPVVNPPDQPWYDTLGDWVLQGFLAIAVSPSAAITYGTLVPKARFAFRTGDLGALWRVLVDGLEALSGDTNTGAIVGGLSADPTILEYDLDIAAFAAANSLGPGPWTIQVEHAGQSPEQTASGAARLEVVRKNLRAPSLCDVYLSPPSFAQLQEDYFACYGVELEVPTVIEDIRFDPDTCAIQVLIGGVWIDKINAHALRPAQYVQSIDGINSGGLQYTIAESASPGEPCDPETTTLVLTLPTTPGPQGADGASAELRVLDGFIQWRQDDDDPTWSNLVALSALEGEQGPPGAPGLPGLDGTDGIDGDDGVCEDCNPPAPAPELGSNPSETICGIAAYVADWTQARFDESCANIQSSVAAAKILADLVSDLIAAIPIVGQVVDAVVDFAIDVSNKDIVDLRNVNNVSWKEEMQCWLYCNMPADGNVTETFFAEFQTWLNGQIRGPLLTAIGLSTSLMWGSIGYPEFRRRVLIGSTSPSSSCAILCECEGDDEWCYEWDFTVNNGGWTNWTQTSGGTMTHSSSGWQQTGGSSGFDGVSIRRQLGATISFHTIEIHFQSVFSGSNPTVRAGDYSDSMLQQQNGGTFSNPVVFTGSFSRSGLSVYVNKALGAGTQYFTDNYITKVVIKGDGTRPTELSGGDDCV